MLEPLHPSGALPAVIALALSIPLAAHAVAQSPATADRPDLPPLGRLVDVGGYRLHTYCTGTRSPGRPTVVLSAGDGDFAVDWGLVQPAVAESARVCSYDRAGTGWSDPGPEPRTLHQEAAELDLLLANAGEQPAYVLVGHSVGALVVRVFQEQRPHNVVGMVLVDPTHEDARLGYRGSLVQMRTLATGRPVPPVRSLAESPPSQATGPALEACRAAAAASAVEVPFDKLPARDQEYHLWALRHPACLANQQDYLPDELAAIYARRRETPQPLGGTPLIVIAAVPGSAPPGVSLDEWRREKADHMSDLARLSSRGRVVTDAPSGHHLQLDDPLVVIRAIRDVIREVQQR
ncbi:MAG: alpha/beta hydrolase [Gemmatimonadota bacterium]|nr:alpha/beta hydrolase [Gemmatimonadota bacterium]MDH4349567.1 alpha/beta hydrolase [Gemmatimonadota bacterium]MDH5195743.1 alpha/beta hydrolase [Gemmatimonadota bacterium]